jgi:GT2 family glycosyltransferase
MSVPLLVLNYNGRALLAECLPSLVAAARRARCDARVVVIDNSSTDDSRAFLAKQHPAVEVIDRPNFGLTSYNSVLAEIECDVALLLNNDVKLDDDAIDRLVAPLQAGFGRAACFMTAPQCRRFDGVTYEGLKTAVRWRLGLVQASCFYPGHSVASDRPACTACAGPVMAVRRQAFLKLGGFDPLYLPGRLEDLDLVYRAYRAGWHARYVPGAVAYHAGGATFHHVFGAAGSDQLALRNTLLFQWKNLRHPAHWLREATGISARLLAEPLRAIAAPRDQRWRFTRAVWSAWRRWQQMGHVSRRADSLATLRRERDYFRRFHPTRIDRSDSTGEEPQSSLGANGQSSHVAPRASELAAAR